MGQLWHITPRLWDPAQYPTSPEDAQECPSSPIRAPHSDTLSGPSHLHSSSQAKGAHSNFHPTGKLWCITLSLIGHYLVIPSGWEPHYNVWLRSSTQLAKFPAIGADILNPKTTENLILTSLREYRKMAKGKSKM